MLKKNFLGHVYFNDNENCEECGSDDVITLTDSNGGSYDHCNDCGHDSSN